MLFELSVGWMIAVDIVAWAAIHLGVAWGLTRPGPEWFDPRGWLFRPRGFERGGRIYEHPLAVQRWKGLLPDGAALFARGFRKKSFRSRERAYLERFARETCRGELVHWTVMACAPLFWLWNTPVAGLFMLLYAVLANLPFILVQRYNRLRLQRVLARMDEAPPADGALLPVGEGARC